MKHFFRILTILLNSVHGDDDGVEIPQKKAEVTEIKADELETKEEVTKTKVNVMKTKAEVTKTKVDVMKTKAEVTKTKVDVMKTKAEVTKTKVDVTETKAEVTEIKPIKNVTEIEAKVIEIKPDITENIKIVEEIEAEAPKTDIIYGVSVALKKGERYSFESYNFPGYFIRHEYFLGPGGFLGEITKIKSLQDKKDASFEVVPGLADNRYISFESLNLPGYFLRHQGFRLKLRKSSNDQGFKNDATFKVKSGLAFDSLVSFESLNYPGRYIRHRNFHMYLEKGNDYLFRKDATFRINPASIWVDAPTSFNYIGNFPNNLSRKLYDNMQGITHDDHFWYFSQKKETSKVGKNKHAARLHKFKASDDLSKKDTKITEELEGYGDHPGDITYFKRDGFEYIFVPMYKEDAGKLKTSRIVVFRASDLKLVVASYLSDTIDKPSWVALDPSGRLYHNNHHIHPELGKRIQVYDVDWNKIANKDRSFLTHLGEFPLYREDGTEFATKQLNHQQGAAFSPNGNLFFMSHGGYGMSGSLSGIKVFDAQTGQIIFRSSRDAKRFKFEFNPSFLECNSSSFLAGIKKGIFEEPQGLTVWDLDDPNAPDAPNISGQLHVILLRNETSLDDLYFKHYRVPYKERCRLLDKVGFFIGRVRNSFNEVVSGATLAFVSENGQVRRTIKSDRNGRYAINLPKLTRYSVVITHSDYPTFSNKWHVPNECGGHQSSDFTLIGAGQAPGGEHPY